MNKFLDFLAIGAREQGRSLGGVKKTTDASEITAGFTFSITLYSINYKKEKYVN